MKKKGSKADLKKFSSCTDQKKRDKERARRELMRIIESTGVKADGVRIGFSRESGSEGSGATTVRGIFSSARGGFGFVTPEGAERNERDIFIPEGKTLSAMDGDLVEVSYKEYRGYDSKHKTEGRVKKILEYGKDEFIGTVLAKAALSGRGRRVTELRFSADDRRVSIEPRIVEGAPVLPGDKVLVKIKRNTFGGIIPECKVLFVFGQAGTISADEAAILAECEIEEEFSSEELSFAEVVSKKQIDLENRRLIKERTMTIDGAGAKDLDDAVSVRRHKDGFLLSVHIADVSYYVEERTALDRLCMARGNSVYFVDKVVPMLPPVLSNGACSLHPGEPKATITCQMLVSHSGELLRTEIFPSVIESDVRGVYSEVNSILSGDATPQIKQKYKCVFGLIERLHELYLILSERSKRRGYFDLSLPESFITLDDEGEPSGVGVAERGVSERMIEQFMLLSGEAVATKLSSLGIPCVYRVHENPPEDQIRSFLSLLSNLGFSIRGIDPTRITAHDLSSILKKAEEEGKGEIISYALLRSMAKARYSHEPEGHFGLSLKYYCHFTSPIRRLSDLITHRIIRATLFEGKNPSKYLGMARRAAAAAGECELKALRCERRIEDMYKAIYMRRFLGEQMWGVVCSVASFGVFVRLDNTCEGLISAAYCDYGFYLDEESLCAYFGNKRLRVSDRVCVRVEEVDASFKVRLSLLD